MSDEMAKTHQEIATRNSREAIKKADATRDELLTKISHLENLVANLAAKTNELEQKYNMLLTARFDGKATA